MQKERAKLYLSLVARMAQKLFIERIMKSQNCLEYENFQSLYHNAN